MVKFRNKKTKSGKTGLFRNRKTESSKTDSLDITVKDRKPFIAEGHLRAPVNKNKSKSSISAESVFSPESSPVTMKKGAVVVKRSGRFIQVSCPTHLEAEIIVKAINDLLE
jgi:hypothetical protein